LRESARTSGEGEISPEKPRELGCDVTAAGDVRAILEGEAGKVFQAK
jgi:hypothetical protein